MMLDLVLLLMQNTYASEDIFYINYYNEYRDSNSVMMWRDTCGRVRAGVAQTTGKTDENINYHELFNYFLV